MPKAQEHHIIVLHQSSDYRYANYGILFTSRYVYQTSKSHSPTRLVIWTNEDRPNPDLGKQVGDKLRNGNVVTAYSERYTRGAYLDPHNEPTDAPVSILLSTESTAICADTGMNTGQPGSGQVYDKGVTLGDGDTATLVYPFDLTRRVTLHFPPHANGHGYATFDS